MKFEIHVINWIFCKLKCRDGNDGKKTHDTNFFWTFIQHFVPTMEKCKEFIMFSGRTHLLLLEKKTQNCAFLIGMIAFFSNLKNLSSLRRTNLYPNEMKTQLKNGNFPIDISTFVKFFVSSRTPAFASPNHMLFEIVMTFETKMEKKFLLLCLSKTFTNVSKYFFDIVFFAQKFHDWFFNTILMTNYFESQKFLESKIFFFYKSEKNNFARGFANSKIFFLFLMKILWNLSPQYKTSSINTC